jgi:hypothetical protein
MPIVPQPLTFGLAAAGQRCWGRCSGDVAVFEVGEDQRGAGDVTDLPGASGDVLQDAPALVEQGEPAFAQAAQRALDGVSGAATGIQFPPVSRLFDRHVDADVGAVVAKVGKGRQAIGGRGPVQRGQGVGAGGRWLG